MEIARKVSGATLTQGRNLRNIEKETYLGRIYGVAESVDSVETPFGTLADRFSGEFACARPDGEVIAAPVCFIPSAVSGLTAKAVRDNAPIKFGFDFYAVPSDKSKTGYTWKAQPLMDYKQSESLLAFASSFPSLPGVEQKPDQAKNEETAHRRVKSTKA